MAMIVAWLRGWSPPATPGLADSTQRDPPYTPSSSRSGRLLLAGFIPGLISAVIYAVIISGRVIVSPELAPATEKFSLTAALKATPGTWPIVAVAIIFGAIYRSWATRPTPAPLLSSRWRSIAG